jgi:hypothetical protein
LLFVRISWQDFGSRKNKARKDREETKPTKLHRRLQLAQNKSSKYVCIVNNSKFLKLIDENQINIAGNMWALKLKVK